MISHLPISNIFLKCNLSLSRQIIIAMISVLMNMTMISIAMRIKDKAGEYARAGKRFSIRHLAQFVRFEMHTNGTIDGFKMNNSITPCLARRLVQEVPAVAGRRRHRSEKLLLVS